MNNKTIPESLVEASKITDVPTLKRHLRDIIKKLEIIESSSALKSLANIMVKHPEVFERISIQNGDMMLDLEWASRLTSGHKSAEDKDPYSHLVGRAPLFICDDKVKSNDSDIKEIEDNIKPTWALLEVEIKLGRGVGFYDEAFRTVDQSITHCLNLGDIILALGYQAASELPPLEHLEEYMKDGGYTLRYSVSSFVCGDYCAPNLVILNEVISDAAS